uniref:Nucleoside diphosphate kinase-like domain-containing protein n=1 Tax=Ursus americanus TaxID=9643 RepID=A0A452RZK3_URSAM
MFFPNLTAYMSSGPLVAMILARHKAISYWKELLGPSNTLVAKETHPDSLRAIYGTDDLRNALHGSNDFAAAEREIRFMFPEGELLMSNLVKLGLWPIFCFHPVMEVVNLLEVGIVRNSIEVFSLFSIFLALEENLVISVIKKKM